MVDGVLLFFIVIAAYVVGIYLLRHRGMLRGPVWEAIGPLVMWRTQQGKRLIDRLSRYRRFWGVYGDVGVAVTILTGVAIFALLIIQLTFLFDRPDLIRRAAPGPEYFLVLPGINPLIPIGYGILGIAVALIVHEGAHGVLSRAHDIKVKSLGLLFFVVPIGAFVEPDDAELEAARTRVKNRVFAAGVMTNLVFALVAAALFSAAFWGSAQPATDGMAVGAVTEGLGAAQAGIVPGMVLTHVDGRPVRDVEEFNASLAPKAAGETAQVTLYHRGQVRQLDVLLTDKYAYYQATAPEQNQEDFRGRGFMGVTTFPMSAMRQLRDVSAAPLDFGVAGFFFYIGLPFQGFNPLPAAYEDFFVIQGPLGALPVDAFWILANSLYWIFWLNFVVGSFNALPMSVPLPLDGGQMFRASLQGILRRRFGIRREKLVVEKAEIGAGVVVRGTDEDTQVKVERVNGLVHRTIVGVGFFILLLILLPIVGPWLL